MTTVQGGGLVQPLSLKVKVSVCSYEATYLLDFCFCFFMALVWVFFDSLNYLIFFASAGPWVTSLGPVASVEEMGPLPVFSPSLAINNRIGYPQSYLC